jgi:pimeloyl-ACP methyl ester carboxylesterase
VRLSPRPWKPAGEGIRMHVEVNGTHLWFDVDGSALVPEGSQMRQRPTVVLLHGGPGSYDHSYFKPEFARLSSQAQVVYLDLRGHGRSGWGDPANWSFEVGADDVRALCDALGIVRPVVYGHSMGGFIAMLYGARHPGHAAALVLQSTHARFDLARLVEGFRRFGGDAVAELAERDYDGDPVSEAEWAQVFAAFGPQVPGELELARRIRNPELEQHGMELFRRFDAVAQLAHVDCPTLVCVGELDPVTPVAAAREINDGLPEGTARLEVIEGAGHFPWKDAPDRYWPLLIDFVVTHGRDRATSLTQ